MAQEAKFWCSCLSYAKVLGRQLLACIFWSSLAAHQLSNISHIPEPSDLHQLLEETDRIAKRSKEGTVMKTVTWKCDLGQLLMIQFAIVGCSMFSKAWSRKGRHFRLITATNKILADLYLMTHHWTPMDLTEKCDWIKQVLVLGMSFRNKTWKFYFPL